MTREMVHYARQDTHYLLYIYDRIRTELKFKALNERTLYPNLMTHILNQSKRVCLLVYKKPVLRSFQYKQILQKNKMIHGPMKVRLLERLLL